ncbi:MAG: 50S ribosomal protein L3 N(5)-glutamine methyltransferase [Gammaproteobacteria bacterium]|nr:50S ribosomal protein L3 N(5)-glutamine methyltransferase [Gammaproteobacteria bacterium]
MNETGIDSLSTIKDYIRWAASRFNEANIFFGHGTDNAFDEAAYLTLHTLHLPADTPSFYFDTHLTSIERDELLRVFRKRVDERMPAPYITHESWFCGIPFYVDERVLIPRSPIAELIEQGFAPWIEPEMVGNVLDLCTGSGCIAIASALSLPDAQVDGADLSDDALAVAHKNIEELGVADQVNLIKSDLFGALKGKKYDVIVTNPPYVDQPEMDALPEEFRHEPRMALESGDDGLDAIKVILAEADEHLNDGGILIAEVGASQPQLEETFPELPFTWLEFERGGSGIFLLTKEQLPKS